jgi:hypothetical protein
LNFEKNTRSASALVRHEYVRKFVFLISKRTPIAHRPRYPQCMGWCATGKLLTIAHQPCATGN